MHTLKLFAAGAVLVALASSDAAAQPFGQKFWISINGGMQLPAAELSDRFDFERFVETGSADVDYDSDPAVYFDGGIGVRLWRRIGAAVSVSHFTRDAAGQIGARIPHPFFDRRLRDVSGSIDGVTRAETGVHAQLTCDLDSRGPLKIVLSGGPSILSVEQELVTAILYTESFPFDEATFTSADTIRPRSSGVGFNVGADIMWMTGRQFGIGGMVRYTRASVDLDWTDASTNARRSIPVKGGGLQAGAGIRVQF